MSLGRGYSVRVCSKFCPIVGPIGIMDLKNGYLYGLLSNSPVALLSTPGGVTLAKIVRGCACQTSKIGLSLYQFFAQLPTHQYIIFDRKAPNFAQIGCIKYTQFFNLGSFVSDENPPITILNFAKKRPKRQAHIRIPCQCENPPRVSTKTKLEYSPRLNVICSQFWYVNTVKKFDIGQNLQFLVKNFLKL